MQTFINEKHLLDAKQALKRLVEIESVLDEADKGPGHPFGKRVVLALDEVLKICDNLGFKSFKDPEGFYAYAEIGDAKEIFGILCHMDVVPASDQSGWETNPFEFIEKDGVLIGRGTQDDKGPSVAALYAVKSLMDAGYTFNKRIRFIFGSDEENLWRCLAEYNKKEEEASMGFAPDSHFPLNYAEKGLLQAYLTGAGTTLLSLKTGGALNVVPDKAEYSGDKTDEIKAKLESLNFDYHMEEEKIIVHGKSIHAMMAPEGINAITRLSTALADSFDLQALDFLGNLVAENATGENVVGKTVDESGELTMNFASLEISESEIKIGVDMRIPVTFNKDELAKKLSDKATEYGLTYQEFDWIAPLHVPIESELVQTLLTTYREFTGDMTEPMISGGATFARMMKNCVAFGAMFPDTPDYMHQANEQWSVEDFKKTMEIYAEAIYRLCV
ncbi:MAG: M20 family metallopeptidase [Lactovum sp.]